MTNFIRKVNKKINKRKRVYLSTSSGSITMEAAITITMFMLIVFYLMSLLTMLGKVFSKQVFLNTMSKKLSKAVYYVDVADQITDCKNTLKEGKEKIQTLAKESEKLGFDVKDVFYDHGNISFLESFYSNKTTIENERLDWN